MDERRRKHGWTFWVPIALIVMPVLYVGSFGAICWLLHRNLMPAWLPDWSTKGISVFYWPLHSGVIYAPEPLPSMVRWYMNLLAP